VVDNGRECATDYEALLPAVQPLSPEEIETLDVAAAQRRMAQNANALIEINVVLMRAEYELSKWRSLVTRAKGLKSTVIEVNRALKSLLVG